MDNYVTKVTQGQKCDIFIYIDLVTFIPAQCRCYNAPISR